MTFFNNALPIAAVVNSNDSAIIVLPLPLWPTRDIFLMLAGSVTGPIPLNRCD